MHVLQSSFTAATAAEALLDGTEVSGTVTQFLPFINSFFGNSYNLKDESVESQLALASAWLRAFDFNDEDMSIMFASKALSIVDSVRKRRVV